MRCVPKLQVKRSEDLLAKSAQAALFSRQGVNVGPMDGIIGASSAQKMKNIGILITQQKNETDRTILEIMLEKPFSGLQKPRRY